LRRESRENGESNVVVEGTAADFAGNSIRKGSGFITGVGKEEKKKEGLAIKRWLVDIRRKEIAGGERRLFNRPAEGGGRGEKGGPCTSNGGRRVIIERVEDGIGNHHRRGGGGSFDAERGGETHGGEILGSIFAE